MKYDLKAMDFDPKTTRVFFAFLWDKTPEGYEYWNEQCIYGLTPEGQEKWDAMKQQWKEENGVPEQQYVVIDCDGDATVCYKAEAEQMCADGLVDAVYKLGDKVNVTVKVEFNP